MTPDIAFAASAREWSDRVHRHLLDHGGGRVVARFMTADQALGASFDVLLVDDICSFLSPLFVSRLKSGGVEVVGVYSPSDGPDAKRRLLECGIGDVIEAGASAKEFLEKATSTLAHRTTVADDAPVRSPGCTIGVAGVTDGVGATEVAISLALGVAAEVPAALVDLDAVWPSVAQRLDLSVHPNLRTALDVVLHGTGELASATHHVDGLEIVGGLADGGLGSPIIHSEVAMLLDFLAGSRDAVIVDLGALDRAIRPVLAGLNFLVVVGSADPVGISRLIRTLERHGDIVDGDRVVVVANRVPQSRFHEAEIQHELQAAVDGLPVVLLPFDRRLADLHWEGVRAHRGRFARSLEKMSQLIIERVKT